MSFYKFGCSYVRLQCTIFKMHDAHSVSSMITDLRSLIITCIKHMCYKCLAWESLMASILKLTVGSSLSCPLYPYMEVWDSLICMAKFPWEAHGQPTPLPTEFPTVSIYESSGQSKLHGRISTGHPLRCPCAANGQRSGQLPCFSVWEHSLSQCESGISALNVEKIGSENEMDVRHKMIDVNSNLCCDEILPKKTVTKVIRDAINRNGRIR